MAQRGVTPVTQYVPAFKGAPSRVHIINLPRYGMTALQAAVLDRCVAALASGPHSAGGGPCGDAASTSRLQALWSAARS